MHNLNLIIPAHAVAYSSKSHLLIGITVLQIAIIVKKRVTSGEPLATALSKLESASKNIVEIRRSETHTTFHLKESLDAWKKINPSRF